MLSLRSSLILIFVLLVAAPLGVFWAWPHSKALQNELDEVRDRHLLLARNLGTALQRYYRDSTAAFDFVADALLANQPLPDPQAMLTNLRFRSICIVDSQTRRISRGYRGLGDCPESLPVNTLALLKEIAVDGRTVLSPVHLGTKGEPLICWVRQSGKRLIVGAIDTRYFVEYGKSISFGTRGHAVIVDQTGKVLAHPFPAWETEMRDISKISVVGEMLKGRTGIDKFYSPAMQTEVIAGYASVPGPGWGVMVPQPISELTEVANKMQRSALALFAMSLLAAALVACRAAFTLLNPVTSVIGGATAMARGAANIRLPAPGRLAPAELAHLTHTFNDMAASVEAARHGEAEARQAAELANRSKTDFLRTVTHELRSPINAIVGFSDLLTSGKLGSPGSPESKDCINDIRSGACMLLSLTNDLLDLARIEAGQYEIAEEIVDLLEISARAARFMGPAAKSRNQTIAVEIEPTFPAIRGDERALFQSVLNLVSNAVKYGRANGAIQVSARLLADGGVSIVVDDDGPGIAPEDIGRVLQPFQRIASAANREVHGTGLGLPIVKKLVELHGGDFRIESKLDFGTKAIIHLPMTRVVQEPMGYLQAAE